MKNINGVFITGLLLFFTLPLFSQIKTLDDIDWETGVIAEQIIYYVNSTGLTGNIETAVITCSGTETPLGNYWRQNLISRLAGRSSLTILSSGAAVSGDYILDGEILDLVQSVRVYTRLIDKSNSVVLASWASDLEKTPFLENLFVVDSSSERSTAPRDEYEEDSWEKPVPVTIGGPVLSRAIHEDDRDWFLICPETSILAAIETSGSLDTVMELYDQEKNKLTDNDDGGEDENARIIYFLEKGKIYIAMVRAYSGETGSYQFFVRETELPDKEMEPNDTLETAFLIELGKEIRAHLAQNDPDWYSFSLETAGYVRIITRGRMDKILYLYDSTGRELAMKDDSESNDNAIIFRFLESGTYYILVKGYGKNIIGSYALLAFSRENAELDSYESDDDPVDAKEIKIGETQRRNFTDGYDMDWVFFKVDTGGRYVISARGETSTDLDTKLELYDDNLKIIDMDDDGGPGYSSLLSVNLDAGLYYIEVKCLEDDPEDYYLLSLERE